MSYIERFTCDKYIAEGKLADFAKSICQMLATDFDDKWRAFYFNSFSSPDFETLVYSFNTDYNELFKVYFKFNDFSVVVRKYAGCDGFVEERHFNFGTYLTSL